MKATISWLIEHSSNGNGPNLVGVAYRNDRDPVLFDDEANILRPEIRGCIRPKCQGASLCGVSTATRISEM